VISKATGTAEQEHVFMLSEHLGDLRLRIRANDNTDTLIGGEIPTGTWTHVAGTYDSESGVMRLFIDGQEQESKLHEVGGPLASGPDVPVWLGGNPDGSEYLGGLLDGARVYSRALSPTELANLASDSQ
jgi:hypothetical protein